MPGVRTELVLDIRSVVSAGHSIPTLIDQESNIGSPEEWPRALPINPPLPHIFFLIILKINLKKYIKKKMKEKRKKRNKVNKIFKKERKKERKFKKYKIINTSKNGNCESLDGFRQE